MAKVYGFFEQRVRNILTDRGYRYDVIEAVIACGYDNLTETVLRAEAVNKLKATDSFAKLLTAFTRANNLAKKAENDQVNEEYLVHEAEKILWQDIQFAEKAIGNFNQKRQYQESLVTVSTLEESISQFFDGVLVMDENENIKNNRLALLVRVSNLPKDIADLTKIVQD